MGLVEDLGAFVELLDDLKADYMIVGGLALQGLGIPRSTLDIDVQARLRDPPARHASYFHGWFVDERSKDEVFDQETLILEGRESGVPVELFLTSHWFTRQALERRQTVESSLLDREIPIPTAEDFVLLKAAYWQSDGRAEAKANQDRLDIEGVVEAHGPEMDLGYVKENATQLAVWDDLAPLVQRS